MGVRKMLQMIYKCAMAKANEKCKISATKRSRDGLKTLFEIVIGLKKPIESGFSGQKERTLTFYQNQRSYLVEARGIEPLSENHLPWLSPSAVHLLGFPSSCAGGQAYDFGSRPVMTGAAARPGSRSPLIDAFIPTAVLRVKTAA